MMNHFNKFVEIQPAIAILISQIVHLIRHKIWKIMLVLPTFDHVPQLAHVDVAVFIAVVL